jgi:hypothetical protein
MANKLIKEKLLTYMIDNYNTSIDIKTFCDKLLFSIQKDMVNNTIVYVAKYKDKKTDKTYLTGKAFFPVGIDKLKEIKVYVGAIDDFPNGTRDESAKLIAKRKISKKMRELIGLY